MLLITIAFIGGVLTILAPCILPVLPVILGVTVIERKRYTPYVVVGAFSISVVAFTLFFKMSTLSLRVPPTTWSLISGTLIILLGVAALISRSTLLSHLPQIGHVALSKGMKKKSYLGDIIAGAALGPIFATCSPIYFFILASILPATMMLGSLALIAYAAGLSLMLLIIAFFGERLIGRLSSLAGPLVRLRQVFAVLFIVLGFLIIFSIEKDMEAYLLEKSPVDLFDFEYRLLRLLP